MEYTLEITAHLRQVLKKPLGVLIEGAPEETVKIVKKYIKEIDPPLMVAVGDIVSRNLLNAGVKLNVFIVDGKTLRTSKETIETSGFHIINLKNTPAQIDKKSWEILKKAYALKQLVEIRVDGEEDLLALPAVMLAPNGSLVFYGQPPIAGPSGVVMIKVNDEKKKEFQGYIDQMKKI
ncbi:MAG: GTP-dependent dephospho-CoA kinase family protein [Candidatus Helarchaeota archaeon]